MFQPPFRWNIQRRNELGSLLDGPEAEIYSGFLDDLLPCCAKVIGYSDDSDLYFVGRSPESLFDHLSGLLLDSSWAERLRLVQFSMRWWSEHEIRVNHPGAIEAMRDYLSYLELSPKALLRRERPAAFVDLIAYGETLGNLVKLLHRWSRESGVEWEAVRRKLRLVGITRQEKPSPKTWRWWQHAEWLPILERRNIKNLAIGWTLWSYLGNDQPKVTISHVPQHWAREDLIGPNRSEEHLKALRLAVQLFDLGCTRERRLAFARAMSEERAMMSPWFRALAQELSVSSKPVAMKRYSRHP
jgi:hypothetical protein